jgi:hypothetical protein
MQPHLCAPAVFFCCGVTGEEEDSLPAAAAALAGVLTGVLGAAAAGG